MTSANDLHLYERRDDYIPRVDVYKRQGYACSPSEAPAAGASS